MKTALITNCTVSRNYPPLVRVADIPPGTMDECVEWWTTQLKTLGKDKKNLHTPGEIYKGVSFDTVAMLTQLVDRKRTYIVTGGQGLIGLDTKIVPYDFTADKKQPDNIHNQVRGEKFVPTVWWSRINEEMRGSGHPISDLLRDDPELILFAALTKPFIKYIVNDLLSLDKDVLRKRVFIPIPRSSLTSFPKSLRPALVPYEHDYVEDIDYTRYDKPHRVLYKFLTEVLERYEEDGTDPCEVAEEIASRAIDTAAQRVVGEGQEVNYDSLFEQHPDLLNCSTPEQAIRLLKVLGLPHGGKHRFAAAWRGAKGRVVVDGFDESVKQRGLENFKLLVTSGVVKSDTDELLRRCGLFVKIAKEHAPDIVFTASTVAQWGRDTFGEDDTSGITSAVKLAYILEYNSKYLGIRAHKSGGKLQFTLEEDNDT